MQSCPNLAIIIRVVQLHELKQKHLLSESGRYLCNLEWGESQPGGHLWPRSGRGGRAGSRRGLYLTVMSLFFPAVAQHQSHNLS